MSQGSRVLNFFLNKKDNRGCHYDPNTPPSLSTLPLLFLHILSFTRLLPPPRLMSLANHQFRVHKING